jgi:DNA-binding CsgD family transcriptional regulator
METAPDLGAVELLPVLRSPENMSGPGLERDNQTLPTVPSSASHHDLAELALDFVPLAVLFTDYTSKVLLMNSLAKKVLNTNDGLGIRNGQLVAAASKETSALRSLLLGVIRAEGGRSPAGVGVITISRPSMKRPYEVVATALGVNGTPLESSAIHSLAVFIGDPSIEPAPAQHIVSGLYGLTSAETRVAILLMRGRSLEETSVALHITKETARKQLRSVFSKTDTRCQSQLVRLLMSGPASLLLPERHVK